MQVLFIVISPLQASLFEFVAKKKKKRMQNDLHLFHPSGLLMIPVWSPKAFLTYTKVISSQLNMLTRAISHNSYINLHQVTLTLLNVTSFHSILCRTLSILSTKYVEDDVLRVFKVSVNLWTNDSLRLILMMSVVFCYTTQR